MTQKLSRTIEVKDKKRSYIYKQLDKCDIGENVNFYAIVLDATFPHQSRKSKKYLATFKVADVTSRIDSKGVADYISIVFFADKFEDLPICQKVGDLIRVHRATVSTYKDRKQFTANVCFNSSWALFPLHFRGQNEKAKASMAEEFSPTSFFGKSVQVEREEHTRIRNLRKWATKSFQEMPVLSNQFVTKLARVSDVAMPTAENPTMFNDFDLQVKVVQLFTSDQYKSEMRVIDDSNEIWHCQVYNQKYKQLREGQYVRIRGCTLYNFANKGYERTFGMRPYANILRLPYPCKLAQEMLFDEQSATQEFEVQQLASNSTIMHPVIISQIKDDKLQWAPVSFLSRVNEAAKVIESEQLHRVRVNVVGFQLPATPADLFKQCVRIYDLKTGKSRQADAKATLKSKNEQVIFSLPIFVKDFSNLHSNQVTVMHLVDNATDASNGFFPGIAPVDLIKNKASQQKALQALTLLQKFNVWLEAVVSVNPDGHMIIQSDLTQLKAY